MELGININFLVITIYYHVKITLDLQIQNMFIFNR